MLGLTTAQGVILAVGGVVFVAVAIGSLALRTRARGERPDIPRAMRPGPSDPDLETPLLQRLQGWGVVLIAFFVIWMPLVWLQEPSANQEQEAELRELAIERGRSAVELYTEANQLGVGCTRCHGPELRGTKIIAGGQVYSTPDLTNVCGGPSAGHATIKSLADLRAVIEQGRPGTPMPSWSIKYAGSLHDQRIEDIIQYLIHINEENVPFADNVCVNPAAATAAASPEATASPEAAPSPTESPSP